MKKNIILFYDERSTHTNTVREHLYSFKDFSRHNIFYAPGSNLYWPVSSGYTEEFEVKRPSAKKWDLSVYDAVVLHYSVRVSLEGYVAPHVADSIRAFKGKKILFLQDEYENVNVSRRNIDDLGFDTVFTCVPESALEYVYEAKSKRSHIEFIPTLTGYVPYLDDVESFGRPMQDRETVVGYRGRRLPHQYGLLGYEKYLIGERFRDEAIGRQIKVDVETDDSMRIYGSWYEFIGSCRATLGTESGCNIFDFDGTLRAKAVELASEPFANVYDEFFAPHEGMICMNQISPKFFEAIMLRTALVCFPGGYSGVLARDKHYIPLERDFSNIDEVLSKLQDIEFLRELTERAYQDIIQPQSYSYRTFVRKFDDWLDSKVTSSNHDIISTPIGVMKDGSYVSFGDQAPSDYLLNTGVLLTSLPRETFCSWHERNDAYSDTATTWNCACEIHGARIAKSSPFFDAPHDAGSLVRPRIKGNYAAGLEGSQSHFIEIDLGKVRPVCGFVLDWLSSTNLAEAFVIKGSRSRLVWKTLASTDSNDTVSNAFEFGGVMSRYIRLEVSRLRGQQRILIKRFEVRAEL